MFTEPAIFIDEVNIAIVKSTLRETAMFNFQILVKRKAHAYVQKQILLMTHQACFIGTYKHLIIDSNFLKERRR